MQRRVVLALDGNSLVHRSFHAQAGSQQPSWAVRGLLTQLVAAVERVRPNAVVIGFDDPDASVRRERWPQYKAHRGDKLEALVEQLAAAVVAMRDLGAAVVVPDGLEADDVLASTAAQAPRQQADTVVVTSDRDAFALIGEHTDVLRIINGGVDASPLMTAERLMMLLGVRPDQYRDFAALRGDASDNLPGVRGVGGRTAARLLAEFGTARAAFDDLDAVAGRVGAGVARRLGAPGAREAWQLNCQVMAMRTDVAVELDLDRPASAGVLPFDGGAVEDVFRSHNLTWSTSGAVRTLAGGVDAVGDTRNAPARRPVRGDDAGAWRRTGVGRRPAALPRKPAAEQLSLFG